MPIDLLHFVSIVALMFVAFSFGRSGRKRISSRHVLGESLLDRLQNLAQDAAEMIEEEEERERMREREISANEKRGTD